MDQKARFDGERDKKPTDARIEREAKKFPRPKEMEREGAKHTSVRYLLVRLAGIEVPCPHGQVLPVQQV